MNPVITGFKRAPDRGRGLARDMRVRWAFEEVGQPYDVRLLEFAEMKAPAHRALQPFGSIPTYEDGDLKLFDSSAIVLHIAETHPGLLPADANARARAITWMFAAISTIEAAAVEREVAVLAEGDKPWREARMPLVEARIRARLTDLANYLGDKEWLDGDFSAADLLMASALQRGGLEAAGILADYPTLAAYIARAKARPAHQRAFDAHYAVFVAASADTAT